MTSGCLDRKEVRGATWGVHSTTDRPAGGNTGRLFLAFGGPVCADRISNCPLDRVLTYKNLIYLLNLQFCVGHLSSVNLVTNAQHAVIDPCSGKVTTVLGEMGNPGFKSKSSHHTEGGLYCPVPVQTQLDKVTDCNKQLPQSSQAVLPFRGTVSADKQKCSRTGGKSKLTGLLQPAIFGTQTQQPVETGPGPEHLEHLFKHGVVQDGDPRDNKNLPTGRGVGHIHRFQRRILPHTNSGSVLPVQSPTLWSIHSSHGVHSGGQRGQTHGTSEGYKDPPVPR